MYVSALYCFHAIYSYYIPWYWNKNATTKNGEESKMRLRDAINSTVMEDNYGYQFLEWGFSPHSSFHIRSQIIEGHSHPDDVRAMAAASLNRKNRYR
jgi:hypothetical protein